MYVASIAFALTTNGLYLNGSLAVSFEVRESKCIMGFLEFTGGIKCDRHHKLQASWRLVYPVRVSQSGAVWITGNIIQLPESPRTHEVQDDLRPE